MRVAVPSGVRKKTALRVQRSVAVGYVGVGWGGGGGGGVGMVGRSAVKHKNSGIIKGVGHRKDSLAGVASVSPSSAFLSLSSPSCTQSRKFTVGTEDLRYLLLLAVLQTS